MIGSGNSLESVIAKNLYSTFDKLRGMLPLNELIEPLVMLAVIKKLEPEIFDEAFKQPIVTQKHELLSVLRQSDALRDYDFDTLARDAFTADMLQALIYFVNNIESMPEFVGVLYDVYFSVSGRQGGEVVTSRSLSEIIKRFVGDVTKSTVFDGAAGLCSVVSSLNAGQLLLQEKSRTARNIGQGLLAISDKKFEYALGDSLIEPRFNAKADWVIMQPPWGLRLHADNLANIADSKYLAFGKGDKLPTSASDALWVQFALYNANDNGRVALVLPHGWTFRGGYDAKLRKYLLDNDLVESITALPAGVHSFTNIPSLILVLNKNKTKERRGIVNLVDASNLGVKDRRKLLFSEAELDLISSLMKGEKEHELLKKVLLPDIYQDNYNLNIKEYFAEIQEVEIPDYQTEIAKLNELQKAADEAQKKLFQAFP